MILALFEGVTEENILNGLKKRKFIEFDVLGNTGGSSGRFRKATIDILFPYFKIGKPLGVVILRDLDSGKTAEDVRKSTEDALNEALHNAEIETSIKLVQRDSNIFFAKNEHPKFMIVLHIAQKRCIKGIPTFKNCTTDDYVLDLALRKEAIENLPEFKEAQEKNPGLTAEVVQRKVTSEILNLLEQNGLRFGEAKNFVDLYIAVLQLRSKHRKGSIPYSGLPGKVIAHARQEDVEEVFESWITAFKMVEVIHGT